MADVSTAEIRAWAQENGYAVADRGRIPGAVLHAYEAAHAAVPPQQPAVDDTRPEGGLDGGEGTPPGGVQDDGARRGSGTAPPPVPRQWSSDGRWGAPPPPPPPPAWRAADHRPAWDPAAQPPPPPPPAGTDVMAILALVFGIIPLMGGLLGIAFGISALKRISRTNQPGRGIAVAGIAAGSGWLVLIAGLFVLGLVSGFGDAERADDGAVIERGTLGAADLRPGDCLTSPPSGMTFTVRVVPCQEPHRAEVFGTFQLNGTGYPGDDEVKRFADGGCTEWLPVYVGAARADAFDIVYLRPTGESWRQGDREVTCVLKAPGDAELPPGSAKAP